VEERLATFSFSFYALNSIIRPAANSPANKGSIKDDDTLSPTNVRQEMVSPSENPMDRDTSHDVRTPSVEDANTKFDHSDAKEMLHTASWHQNSATSIRFFDAILYHQY